MKAIISTFFNTLYFESQSESISQYDIRKIKEFRASGNLFGIMLYHNKDVIENILKQYGIEIDFYIAQNGHIEVKNRLDCFSYEPFDENEMYNILNAIEMPYQGYLFNQNLRETVSLDTLNDLKIKEYTLAILKFDNSTTTQQIANLLTQKFGHILQIDIQDNEMTLFSRKGNSEDTIEMINKVYHVDLNDIHIVKNHFVDLDLVRSFNNLYALNQRVWLDKEIIEVDSICDCIELIMLNEKNDFSFFFMSKFEKKGVLKL